MPENIPTINTSVFAHGIKNRLSFIRSKLQLIELETSEKGAFDSIYRELDGINTSVTEFISAPSKSDKKTLFDAKDVILECIFEKLPQANLNGIKIRHRLDKSLKIYASRDNFRESLINMLQNSIEACPERCGEIFVRGRNTRYNTEIYVFDNGCGISQSDMENVLSPFFTTKEKGSGIGLYFCKRFAESSGGELKISAKQGKFTKVTLILPRG